jgi:hypothetical protein
MSEPSGPCCRRAPWPARYWPACLRAPPHRERRTPAPNAQRARLGLGSAPRRRVRSSRRKPSLPSPIRAVGVIVVALGARAAAAFGPRAAAGRGCPRPLASGSGTRIQVMGCRRRVVGAVSSRWPSRSASSGRPLPARSRRAVLAQQRRRGIGQRRGDRPPGGRRAGRRVRDSASAAAASTSPAGRRGRHGSRRAVTLGRPEARATISAAGLRAAHLLEPGAVGGRGERAQAPPTSATCCRARAPACWDGRERRGDPMQPAPARGQVVTDRRSAGCWNRTLDADDEGGHSRPPRRPRGPAAPSLRRDTAKHPIRTLPPSTWSRSRVAPLVDLAYFWWTWHRDARTLFERRPGQAIRCACSSSAAGAAGRADAGRRLPRGAAAWSSACTKTPAASRLAPVGCLGRARPRPALLAASALSGDHLKASDRRPLVGVGCYRRGYPPLVDSDGAQHDYPGPGRDAPAPLRVAGRTGRCGAGRGGRAQRLAARVRLRRARCCCCCWTASRTTRPRTASSPAALRARATRLEEIVLGAAPCAAAGHPPARLA